jgi:IS4 transposase
MYPWAKFRRKKGAVKLHLRLDHDGNLPCFGLVTSGKCHDVKAVLDMPFPTDGITVFDRGYVDYSLFEHMASNNAWFVTRAKYNADYTAVDERDVVEGTGVVSDWIISLNGYFSQKKYPEHLRIVEFYDEKNERTLRFITDIMHLSAQTIAAIYKERWHIELMFKSLKQNLRIKSFVGTSANAVKIRIWTALISILILKYLQLKSQFGWSISNLSALLRMNLFTYRNLWEWIEKPFDTLPEPILEAEQLVPAL